MSSEAIVCGDGEIGMVLRPSSMLTAIPAALSSLLMVPSPLLSLTLTEALLNVSQ